MFAWLNCLTERFDLDWFIFERSDMELSWARQNIYPPSSCFVAMFECRNACICCALECLGEKTSQLSGRGGGG